MEDRRGDRSRAADADRRVKIPWPTTKIPGFPITKASWRWSDARAGGRGRGRGGGAARPRGGGGRGPAALYRPAVPAGVREFIAEQQLAILASIGRDGRLWASLRSGAPGSVTAIDEQTLRIGGYGHPEDPLADNLTAHDQL